MVLHLIEHPDGGEFVDTDHHCFHGSLESIIVCNIQPVGKMFYNMSGDFFKTVVTPHNLEKCGIFFFKFQLLLFRQVFVFKDRCGISDQVGIYLFNPRNAFFIIERNGCSIFYTLGEIIF